MAALLCAASCRAVIGVEDLHLVEAGASDGATKLDATAPEASTPVVDGGVHDSAADALVNSDSSAASDTGASDAGTGCGAMGMECRKCCRTTLGGMVLDKLLAHATATGCLCGAGSCNSECDGSVCGGNPIAPPMMCGQCTDGHITDPATACTTAGDDCAKDVACEPAITCLRSCPK